MSTSAPLPLCVYCGTERPADRSMCPQCGRPWIDVRVGSLSEGRAQVLVGAAATTETPNVTAVPAAQPIDSGEGLFVDLAEDDTGPEDKPPVAPFRRVIPVVLAASAVAVVAMFGLGLLDDEGAGNAAPAATTAPSTTVAPATAPGTTTPLSTTTPTPPATAAPTTTLPDPGSLLLAGEAVPASRLTLHSGGVGPVEIGRPASEVVGVLIASLGTPEEVAIAGEEHGLCAGDDGRLVRWAELTVLVSGTLQSGTFVGYRYQEPIVPTSMLDLATPSGVRLGDSLSTLNEVYAAYSISYESVGESATFSLSEGEELLLWGPVTSIEGTGRIEGIFSPPSCPPA